MTFIMMEVGRLSLRIGQAWLRTIEAFPLILSLLFTVPLNFIHFQRNSKFRWIGLHIQVLRITSYCYMSHIYCMRKEKQKKEKKLTYCMCKEGNKNYIDGHKIHANKWQVHYFASVLRTKLIWALTKMMLVKDRGRGYIVAQLHGQQLKGDERCVDKAE